MATVWHKAALFDPGRASVATWIFTIARNRRIDALRKARRPEPEDLPWGPEAEPDQADAMALQQETEKLGEALALLPDNQRELIERPISAISATARSPRSPACRSARSSPASGWRWKSCASP
jgi:RNA polymerase sigma factor (sigma-70 family)